MQSILAALGLVFVAELGDKTQLVALGFGARHRLRPVLLGVAIAYAASNLLSVVVGGLLGLALPVRAIGIAGGLLFLGFAAWTLRDVEVGGPGEEAGIDGQGRALVAGRSIVLSVATMSRMRLRVAMAASLMSSKPVPHSGCWIATTYWLATSPQISRR